MKTSILTSEFCTSIRIIVKLIFHGSTRNIREAQEESSQRYGSGSRESFKLVVATQRRW